MKGLQTQVQVTQRLFPPIGKADKRKKKVMPQVNRYVQVLEEIGWLQFHKHQVIVTRNGVSYPRKTDIHKANLNPFYEYLDAKGAKSLITSSGKRFFESFMGRKAIVEIALQNDNNIINGTSELLRQYVNFKHTLYIVEKRIGKLDIDSLLKWYEKSRSKITLSNDLYLEFFGIYVNEKEFWTHSKEGFKEKEFGKWQTDLEKFLFSNYADSNKFYSLIDSLFSNNIGSDSK
jgi:hypothetical protein